MRKILILLSLTLVACAPDDGAAGDRDVGPRSGSLSPGSLSIVGFDELEPALVAQRGQGQLINFWAMWCAPCVAELPDLVEVARAYEAEGGRVVGVSYDLMVAGADPTTVEDDVRAFLAARDLADFDVLVYDEIDYEAINERFGLPGEVPVTLAVDRDGRIVDRHEGKAGRERFDELMRKALGIER